MVNPKVSRFSRKCGAIKDSSYNIVSHILIFTRIWERLRLNTGNHENWSKFLANVKTSNTVYTQN